MAGTLEISPSWKYYRAQRNGTVTVPQYCPERAYVELQVPEPAVTVRRIIFRTVSHDQGFSDNQRDFGGTYEQSYSFFEAGVTTPSGHERVNSRDIQYNVHANFEFHAHENCWDYRDQDPTLRKWLSSIRSGDTIKVIPKSRFLGWNNFIREAQIELYVEPLSISPSPIISISQINDYSMYRALNHELKEIRVALIEPGSGDEPLRFSFRYVSLLDEERIPYEALSYCWRATTDLEPITLASPEEPMDQTVLVTSNLFDALRLLRRSNGVARSVWIDFICINQKNFDEREQQVSLMGDIYAAAESVCVWLGEGDKDIYEDFAVIRSISHQYQGSQSAAVPLSAKKAHEQLLDKTHGFYYIENYRLFQCDWFQRVWVLQEAWNAKSALVSCGNDVLPWTDILQANYCINSQMIGINRMQKLVMPALWTSLFEVSRTPPLNFDRVPKSGILEVIIGGLDLQATDPRDKIFALLGFGKETQFISSLPDEVRPNYRKTVLQVYTDFSRWWIEYHRSLKVLSAVHVLAGRTWLDLSTEGSPRNKEYDLAPRPSWTLWHIGRSEWIHGTLGLHDSRSYHASGDYKVDIEVMKSCNDPTRLALKGIRISAISLVSPYPFFHRPIQHPDLHEAYIRIFDPAGAIGTWSNAVSKVTKQVNMPPSAPENEFRDHYRSHWGTGPESGAAPPWLPCHGRCMFETLDGRIGLCPSGARATDLVVILYGGNVPYLLRQEREIDQALSVSKEYYFVGECYVEGLMGGSAVSQENMVDEVFLLI